MRAFSSLTPRSNSSYRFAKISVLALSFACGQRILVAAYHLLRAASW